MVTVGKYRYSSTCDLAVVSREPTEETIFYLGTCSKSAISNTRLDLSCLEKLREDIEEGRSIDFAAFKGIEAEKK